MAPQRVVPLRPYHKTSVLICDTPRGLKSSGFLGQPASWRAYPPTGVSRPVSDIDGGVVVAVERQPAHACNPPISERQMLKHMPAAVWRGRDGRHMFYSCLRLEHCEASKSIFIIPKMRPFSKSVRLAKAVEKPALPRPLKRRGLRRVPNWSIGQGTVRSRKSNYYKKEHA
jgi:hypothetical protein